MKSDTDLRPCNLRHGIDCFHKLEMGRICIEVEDYFSPVPMGVICKFRYCKNGGDEHGEADSSMETLEGLEETEQLQQARSDSDISENQEERLVREFCGLEVREQKMREELSTEWKDLRKRLGNLICRIDGQAASLSAEEKRMEERRDESYWNGVQDLYEAVKAVVAAIEDDGMAQFEIEHYFGTRRAMEAVCKNDPKTIMEKVSKWKADIKDAQKQDEEFHVGDEVVSKGDWNEFQPRKGIITAINHEYLNIAWPIRTNGNLLISNVRADDYKKTGRHFDSIPFSYGREEEANK